MDNIREKLENLIAVGGFFSRSDDAERCVDYLLAHGVTVQGWIPVGEGLPAPFEVVWVYDATANDTIAAYITIHNEWVGVCKSHEITHWAPRPQPPKGE